MRNGERTQPVAARHSTFRRRASFAAPVVIVLVAGCGDYAATKTLAASASHSAPAEGQDGPVTTPSADVPATQVTGYMPPADPAPASGTEVQDRTAGGSTAPNTTARREIGNPPPPGSPAATSQNTGPSAVVISNPPPPPSGQISNPPPPPPEESVAITNPPAPPPEESVAIKNPPAPPPEESVAITNPPAPRQGTTGP